MNTSDKEWKLGIHYTSSLSFILCFEIFNSHIYLTIFMKYYFTFIFKSLKKL
jgi:hypothetical protein